MNEIRKITSDNLDNADDDKPTLSPWAAAALQEFYANRLTSVASSAGEQPVEDSSELQEDWQLSQFWYDAVTANALATEACRLCKAGDTIACVSCPTVYKAIRQIIDVPGTSNGNRVQLRLLEYDRRFASHAGADFVYYDYNEPQRVPEDLRGTCRMVLADPPFLSEECLNKTLETVSLLANDKVILCTGAVMEATVVSHRNLNLKACQFEPHHANKLSNEFKCFANYDLDSHVLTQ